MDNVVTFYRKTPPGITVNGEPVAEEAIAAAADQFADSPNPREAAARSLVVRTLLRQRGDALGIVAEDEESAVDQLLAREVAVPTVSDEEVRRYFEANRQRFRSGDLFEARHILFATAGDADPQAAGQQAERALFHLKNDPESFEGIAAAESSCSSAKVGGALGQISQGAVVPEFWAALTGHGRVGLLPHLVETRFGHHIVRIDRLALGEALPFEAVQARIREYLTGRIEQLSYQRYIAQLIEQATIAGIDLGDQRAQPAGPGLPIE